jgi:hypothetical protein
MLLNSLNQSYKLKRKDVCELYITVWKRMDRTCKDECNISLTVEAQTLTASDDTTDVHNT